MVYTLENDSLRVRIATMGAEMVSIINKENGKEYLWNAGDAWKRHSPVLFPIVGGLKDKSYCHNGKYFEMGQHGFARDMNFEMIEKTKTSIVMGLRENAETLSKFPFSFRLNLSYELVDKKIKVGWQVYNPNDYEMHFSIGGHPAFMCPLGADTVTGSVQTGTSSAGDGIATDADTISQIDCYLHFDEEGPLGYHFLSPEGLCLPWELSLPTDGGFVKLDYNFFDNDAYVMYNDRMRTVSLAGPDKKDYLRVNFNTPVYGIWSAKGKHAPFVCIEPWYGRCDAVNFSGDWRDREYDNVVIEGEEWNGGYEIEIV